MVPSAVMISILVSASGALISGLVLLVVKRGQKKAAAREEDRDERERLTLEALNANSCVLKELVNCVLYKEPPNGELEEAFKYQRNVKHDLETYARNKAAKS